jgi:multiple sugar transport system permease protein
MTSQVRSPNLAAGWRRRRGPLRKPQFWVGLVTLLVTFGWYAGFVFDPMIQSFRMSLQDFNVTQPDLSRFVGLDNYRSLISFDRFQITGMNTLIYAVVFYLLTMVLALLIAWCLANVLVGRRTYQFIIFLPVVVSLVAVSMLFRMIMNPDTGTLNRALNSVGLPGSQWIFGSDSALMSVVLVDVWKQLGFFVVLLTAAMLAVSPELIDQAKVDGAGGWKVFRHVTVPAIMPTIALVSIFAAFDGLQVYVTPTVLGPGPGNSTLMFNQFIVDEAFTSFNIGGATAASVVLFGVMLVLTLVQLKVLRSRSD